MRRLIPDAGFIFITGFQLDEPVRALIDSEGWPCVKKPFDLSEFLTVLESGLQKRGRTNDSFA